MVKKLKNKDRSPSPRDIKDDDIYVFRSNVRGQHHKNVSLVRGLEVIYLTVALA